MTTGEFEKTNWGWQWSQLQQQVGEWLEFQLLRFDSSLPKVPEWSFPKWAVELMKVFALLLLGLLLVWQCLQLWRVLKPYLYSYLSPAGSASRVPTWENQLTVETWLQRSQAYFSQGNYREACRCLYMASLQQLHNRAIAPYQPSRTDGEYLQLVNQLPQSQSYQTLIMTHEQLCFGNVEILPETFAQCQQAYREIARQE